MLTITVRVCTGIAWEKVIKNIEDDLLAIKNWLSDNNLSLNLDESAIIQHSLSEHALPTRDKLKVHEINDCQTPIKCHCDSVTIVGNRKFSRHRNVSRYEMEKSNKNYH